MNLSWRNSLVSTDIMKALERLFTDGDAHGEMTMIFSQSKAKGIFNLELYNGTLMVTRQARSVCISLPAYFDSFFVFHLRSRSSIPRF